MKSLVLALLFGCVAAVLCLWWQVHYFIKEVVWLEKYLAQILAESAEKPAENCADDGGYNGDNG